MNYRAALAVLTNYKPALAVLGMAIILFVYRATPHVGGNISKSVSIAGKQSATSSPRIGTNGSVPILTNSTAGSAFSAQYFRNLNVGATVSSGAIVGPTSPEAYMDIVNPGVNGDAVNSVSTGVGDLCALIYIVDEQQTVQECCGCLVAPDLLIEMPVQADLLSNTDGPVVLHNGAIKMIASAPTGTPKSENDNTVCNPAAPNPTPELLAWITQTRAYAANTGYTTSGIPATPATLGITQSRFEFAPLSAGEQTTLATSCGALSQAKGPGVCQCPNPLPQ